MASSSRRSGVHIQVTTGWPLTSSQTATSSTAADSDILPPRFAGCSKSVDSGTVGIQRWILRDAHPLEHDPIGQPGSYAAKDVDGDRLTGGQRPPVGERRDVEIEVLPGKRRQNFLLDYLIDQRQIHDHAGVVQSPADGDGALIIVSMPRRVGQRTEYLAVTRLAPVGP